MATGVADRVVTIVNIATVANRTLTITHEAATSTAANRFSLPNAMSWIIPIGGSVTFWYDGSSSRWRPLTTVTNTFPAGTGATPGIQIGDTGVGWFEDSGSSLRSDNFVEMSNGFECFDDASIDGLATLGGMQFVGSLTVSPAAVGGTVNDYSAAGDGNFLKTSHLRQATSGALTITGISKAQAQTVFFVWRNLGPDPTTFNNEDAGSTVANRIQTPAGTPFVLASGHSAQFLYDTVSARWTIIGTA
jgi:hypothetical protein